MTKIKVVPDTKESLMARIKREWEAQEKQHETQSKEHVVEYDAGRAQVLAEGVEGGLTQREMAEALGLSQQHINCLLRYHRFNTFVAEEITAVAVIKIPETRFRQYWKQMANLRGIGGGRLPNDPAKAEFVRRQRENERNREEQRIFAQIAEWVQAGKAPIAPPRKPKPHVETTLDQSTSIRQYKSRLHKVVAGIRRDVRADIKALKNLEPTFEHPLTATPALVASYVGRLEATLKRLDNLLKEEEPRETPASETE